MEPSNEISSSTCNNSNGGVITVSLNNITYNQAGEYQQLYSYLKSLGLTKEMLNNNTFIDENLQFVPISFDNLRSKAGEIKSCKSTPISRYQYEILFNFLDMKDVKDPTAFTKSTVANKLKKLGNLEILGYFDLYVDASLWSVRRAVKNDGSFHFLVHANSHKTKDVDFYNPIFNSESGPCKFILVDCNLLVKISSNGNVQTFDNLQKSPLSCNYLIVLKNGNVVLVDEKNNVAIQNDSVPSEGIDDAIPSTSSLQHMNPPEFDNLNIIKRAIENSQMFADETSSQPQQVSSKKRSSTPLTDAQKEERKRARREKKEKSANNQ